MLRQEKSDNPAKLAIKIRNPSRVIHSYKEREEIKQNKLFSTHFRTNDTFSIAFTTLEQGDQMSFAKKSPKI
jgi:hypothetical protein